MRITTRKNINKFARLGLLATLALVGCRGATDSSSESPNVDANANVPQIAAQTSGTDCQLVGTAGTSIECPFEAAKSSDAVAFQFSLDLPPGAVFSHFRVNGQKSDALEAGHALQIGAAGTDGKRTVLAYNPAALDSVGSGVLFNAVINLERNFAASDNAVAEVTNLILSSADGKAL